MRSLIERLKRLFERKQYWLLVIEGQGVRRNTLSDKSPAVFAAEHSSLRILVLNAIRISKRDFDESRKVLQEQKSSSKKAD